MVYSDVQFNWRPGSRWRKFEDEVYKSYRSHHARYCRRRAVVLQI